MIMIIITKPPWPQPPPKPFPPIKLPPYNILIYLMIFKAIVIQLGKTSCERTAGFYGGVILWGKAEIAL